MNTAELILTGARVVTPGGVAQPGWVRVSSGTIVDVGDGAVPHGPAVELSGRWLVPGFVDVHCHGGGGGAVTSLEPEQTQTAVAHHRAHGTTTMLASLVSAPISELVKQIATLAELTADGLIAGVHLEGPFLSHARCGAHAPEVLRAPEADDVQQLLDAGRGAVRMVTLAPELPGSADAVRQLVDGGAVAAVGHTDANAEQVLAAVDAGATVATHLFNGMRPLHHREPGPVGALLDDERVSVELICDLVHLHPTVARLAATHVGTDRTILVTDAISATGAGDGTYELGALPVTVVDGEPRLADGSLAGSTLTMDAAFRNLVVSCGLPVPATVAATATNPARRLGLTGVGEIRPGARADLVVLGDDLDLQGVMRRGQWLTEPS
ncbi:N-acetylglucosamine-6-phosphate deacetylase [Saccharopolyspora rhizosphaerae]|uniref:N-acetylglucosamine-6-phosphate deacetylase n=1 Tax=Saccharopolyspora rhizosphaerae TaxID=2492662 RepID=A0A426JKV1_9PSEU|nr:N-acetylglucosamine-6-phosphate deacetylase [Saccharopolyspora rhizosphaerae]RRO13622.1 N-acetylglucosamine-6-phosphate deacetylase [Saccharopolyspora rhizosphaerae]